MAIDDISFEELKDQAKQGMWWPIENIIPKIADDYSYIAFAGYCLYEGNNHARVLGARILEKTSKSIMPYAHRLKELIESENGSVRVSAAAALMVHGWGSSYETIGRMRMNLTDAEWKLVAERYDRHDVKG